MAPVPPQYAPVEPGMYPTTPAGPPVQGAVRLDGPPIQYAPPRPAVSVRLIDGVPVLVTGDQWRALESQYATQPVPG